MKFARIALLSSLGFSFPLHAATEFEDGLVPAELAREFIGGDLYSSLPDGFPVPEMPSDSGLSVIGSLDHGGVSQQVLLRSIVGWEEARETLREAYVASGWIDLSRESLGNSVSNTVIGLDNGSGLSLCHDRLGTLDFRWRGGQAPDGTIRASRSSFPPSARAGGLSCAQLQAFSESQGTPGIAYSFLSQLMPVLEIPDDAEDTRPFLGISGGGFTSYSGSGMDFRMDRDGTITVPDSSAAALYDHFAAQLEEQSWELDSGALGAASSSSVWLKTAQTPEVPGFSGQDLALTGFMSIVHVEDDQYRILFRLVSRAEGGDMPPIDMLGPPLNTPELGIRGISPAGGGFISGGPIFLPQ